ncbi:MAG: type II toxin-antitoxin system RelE/ParE family toxin [Saprospiraceae bacterium]|nr:type II toxin-antitoxin system RelE/ParE family toxin [Saprospiraceae bacterium]
MKFTFDNKELENLYTTGQSKKLKLSGDIIDKFFARMQQIEAAYTIHDLWIDGGLHFKKLQGYENLYSMRLKDKYRLEMRIEWHNDEKTTGNFVVTRISNHYH